MVKVVKKKTDESSVYVIAKDISTSDLILRLSYIFPNTKESYYSALIYLMYLRCNRTEHTKNVLCMLDVIDKNLKITFEMKFNKKNGILDEDSLNGIRDYIYSPDKQMFLFNESYLTRIKIKILAEINSNKNNKKYFLNVIAKENINNIMNPTLELPSIYSKEYKKDLDKINEKSLFIFYSDVFKNASLKAFIVGNIDDELISRIKIIFTGGFRSCRQSLNALNEEKVTKKVNVVKSKNPDFLLLVYRVKNYEADDYIYLNALCKILNKRLEDMLKFDNDYIYYINAKLDSERRAIYIVTNIIDEVSLKLVKNLIILEIKKLSKKDAISQEELMRVRQENLTMLMNKNNDINLSLNIIEQMDMMNIEKMLFSNLLKKYVNLGTEQISKVSKKLQLIVSYFI